MAAHRYWRATGLEAYGPNGLDITEFHLRFGGARVDAPATLSANTAPETGAVANLKDDATGTGATWSAGALKKLVLDWDFGGAPTDVSTVTIGAADSQSKFLFACSIYYSDDAIAWTLLHQAYAISWPGARAKTATTFRSPDDSYDSLVVSRSDFSSASGLRDDILSPWVPFGAAAIVTGGEPFGAGQLQTGALGYISRPYNQYVHQWWTGPYTAECYVNYSAWPASGLRNLMGSYLHDSGTNDWAFGATGNGSLELYYYNNATQFVTQAAPSMSLGTWYHVAFQFEPPATIKLLIDRVVVATASLVGTPSTSFLAFRMGRAFNVDLSARVKGLRITRFARYPAQPAYAFGDYVRLNALRGRAGFRTPVSVDTLAGTPAGAMRTRLQRQLRGRRDYYNPPRGTGNGRVAGTTKDKGSPNVAVSERVRLYREFDGLLLRETWSTPGTGAYSFDYVDELETYTVISYDRDKAFRAVVADGLTLAGGGVELIP